MILTIINQKGGVAKTTTAANLGAALTEQQANLTAKAPQSLKAPRLRFIDLDVQGSLLRYRKTIKSATFHAPRTADELRALLEKDAPAVVDCPPGLDETTRRLLLAHSDVALIPLQPAYDALIGMVRTIEAVEAAQAENPRLRFKIVLTMYRGRPNAREMRADVGDSYPENLCRTTIPFSLLFEEATALAQPITLYAPDSTAARAYSKLAKETLTWQ